MATLQDYVGQTLDDKYRLERLLGQGGMGAVYLATHLGTERYVALKLITPEFMQNEEFVERFKREAKAAGRLRHPNVVDVTDFGFAHLGTDTVAYLVMEYLDGCTLGDVLREEHTLPLEWVVDILEQVCSAVYEAHQQGIVHRDLKPENIWLEPNRLGGYRVKVLDFGIAKLGQAANVESHDSSDRAPAVKDGVTQRSVSAAATQLPHSAERATALHASPLSNQTSTNEVSERGTMLYADGREDSSSASGAAHLPTLKNEAPESELFPVGSSETALSEAKTLIPPRAQVKPSPEVSEDDRTLMFNQTTRPLFASGAGRGLATATQGAGLTRVGAIMGTPLYMSPEQCAGKGSDVRSDLYSLGVITYQMLAGEPPFTGDTQKVMHDHIEVAPQPLRERRKVPKQVANLVMSALAKDPADRPQTALAFGNALKAQAAGIGSLYRRAFSLYSEYFPKFLRLSLIAHIPVIITVILLIILQVLERAQPREWGAVRITLVCAMVLVGLMQIVAYYLAAAAISGMTAVIVTQVSAAPLRPVEVRTAFDVLKLRWRPFLSTSLRVTFRIILGYVLLFIPGLVMSIRYALYAPVVLMEGLEKKAAMKRARELASRSWRTVIIVSLLQIIIPLTVSALFGRISIGIKGSGTNVTVRNIYQQLSGLVNIFIVPLISIVPALLYLKMRQLGGETLSAALNEIEKVDTRRSQWRQRMRSRPSLPGVRSR